MPEGTLPPEHAVLLTRVDTFSTRAEAAQRPWLACRMGCDGCCRTRRTAFAVEVEAIRQHLATRATAEVDSFRARRETPAVRHGERCVFLSESGACDVYAARPLLCRTHGPAIRTTPATGPGTGLSYCALNFVGLSPAEVEASVPPDAILNLELLNQMLVLINTRHLAMAPGPARRALEEALDP